MRLHFTRCQPFAAKGANIFHVYKECRTAAASSAHDLGPATPWQLMCSECGQAQYEQACKVEHDRWLQARRESRSPSE